MRCACGQRRPEPATFGPAIDTEHPAAPGMGGSPEVLAAQSLRQALALFRRGDIAGADKACRQAQISFFCDELTDFAETAAVLDQVDLVISVDTSIAHLAGAMGKPVWIMLPHVPEWRWMLDRSDSLWYPTARLFRQPRPFDWASVIEDVKRELTVCFGQHVHQIPDNRLRASA